MQDTRWATSTTINPSREHRHHHQRERIKLTTYYASIVQLHKARVNMQDLFSPSIACLPSSYAASTEDFAYASLQLHRQRVRERREDIRAANRREVKPPSREARRFFARTREKNRVVMSVGCVTYVTGSQNIQ